MIIVSNETATRRFEVTGNYPYFHIKAKLGNMRNETDWLIYPKSEGSDEVTLQTKTRIARFDPKTLKGMISTTGSRAIDLMICRGGREIEVEREFADAILEARPHGAVQIT